MGGGAFVEQEVFIGRLQLKLQPRGLRSSMARNQTGKRNSLPTCMTNQLRALTSLRLKPVRPTHRTSPLRKTRLHFRYYLLFPHLLLYAERGADIRTRAENVIRLDPFIFPRSDGVGSHGTTLALGGVGNDAWIVT